MNSIHEPGSQTMSKNQLMNSTESNRVKNRPSAPSAQPIAQQHAQPRAPHLCGARLAPLWRAPHAPLPPTPHACCALLSVVSRHGCLHCDTGSPLFFSVIIQSSVLRYTMPAKLPSLQYKPVYCNTILAIPTLLKPPYCNTI